MDSRKMPADVSTHPIQYIRKGILERSKSFILYTHPHTNRNVKIEASRDIAAGAYGKLRLFKGKNIEFAVKKPNKTFSLITLEKEELQVRKKINNELHYMMLAYPEDGPYALFHFSDPTSDEEYPRHYSYRLLEPFYEGMTLSQFIQKNNDACIIAGVILKIAQELQRIHDKKIIHGDISRRNIIIRPDGSIRFIDFYFAYSPDNEATTTTLPKNTTCYFARERINTTKCKAHYSQDVFSLAYMINEVLYDAYKDIAEVLDFYNKYPQISEFIYRGLSHEPKQRSSIPDFINKLGDLSVLERVKMAFLVKSIPDAIAILNENPQFTNHDTYCLIYHLCNKKQFSEARALIKYLHGKDDHNPIIDLLKLTLKLSIQFSNNNNDDSYHKTLFSTVSKLQIANRMIKVVLYPKNNAYDDELLQQIAFSSSFTQLYLDITKYNYSRKISTAYARK